MNKRLRAVALLSCLSLTSCFTLGLWGVQLDDEVDPVTGTEGSGDEDADWSCGQVGLRVLLTPLTLALDCVTIAAQYGVGVSGDHGCEHHCCHGHR